MAQEQVRVCILAPAFPRAPGGGARTYLEHANGLVQRDYRVTVVHALDRRHGLGARLEGAAADKVRDLRSGSLRRRIGWMRVDPRVELVTIDSLDRAITLPAADVRVGTFWRTSEVLAQHPSHAIDMQLIQSYETWAGPASRVDAVWRLPFQTAVVSRSLLAKGVELGVPEQRLHLVPNGLDHDVFHWSRPIKNRGPQLAFLAHDNPVKGLMTAISVARAVHSERGDVPIVAFGTGRRPTFLPRFVDYVRGLSGSELVARIYDHTSVFLCASDHEGWGYASIEAMACGAALVTTANGGSDEFAFDTDTALVAPVGDVTSLVERVLSLLSDDRRRCELATRGAQQALRFTWAASTDRFEAVLSGALSRGSSNENG